MFCPYVKKSFFRTVSILYDENGLEKASGVLENYENVECKKEECGVWSEGRCRYNEQR